MSLYSEAANAICSQRATRQNTLDRAALVARQECVDAFRRIFLAAPEGATEVEKTVRAHLAENFTVGQDDGYPCLNVSPNSVRLLRAASASGTSIVFEGLEFHHDYSGIKAHPAAHDADYKAWEAARTYRNSAYSL